MIRAFGKSNDFYHEIENRIDIYIRIKNLNLMSNRWLGVRLDCIGVFIVFFAALFAVFSKESTNAGLVGLSISYSLTVSFYL